MDDFKDLNELLTVAKQINEGKYDLIDVNLDPNYELFAMAKFFNNSIKELRSVTSAVEKSYKDLPVFEATLDSVVEDARQASEDVLNYVDDININVNNINDILNKVGEAVKQNDFSKAKGTLDRLNDTCNSGRELCFDIISSLEFKEVSHNKIEKILNALSSLEDQLAHLVIALGLKQQLITADTVDKLKEPKEILHNQTLVNKLLKEFGL